MSRYGRVVLTLLVPILVSCQSGGPGPAYRVPSTTAGPLVCIVDSTVLEGVDSLPLGPQTALARASDGRVFLSDVAGGRILEYSPDGRLIQVLGRRGDGPGEFQMPAKLTVFAHDSLLAVVDPRREYISLMDIASGRYLRGFHAPFQIAGQSWTERDDTWLFSVFPSVHLWARWQWRTDSVTFGGTFPPELAREGNTVAQYGWPEIVATNTGFIASLPTDPGLRLYDTSGTPAGFVMVPAARRRGDPPGLLEQHQRAGATGQEFRYLGSSPAGLFRLSSGETAVLNADIDRRQGSRGAEYRAVAHFLTLVSADFSQACVDGPIPFRSDAMSLPIAVGDTLLMLSQRVTPGNLVRTVLYRFSAATGDCDWVPTGGVRRTDAASATPRR